MKTETSGEERLFLRDFTLSELEKFLADWNVPRFRATQILEMLHGKSAQNFDELKNLPKDLIQRLKQHADVSRLEFVQMDASTNQESTKFLTKTVDGHFCESVLISQSDRQTVCVSTQLGCRIRCVFCASGKGKFGRNLSAGEIVEQVSIVSKKAGKKITNIVFMGMGEPLDNYDATLKAIQILQAEWGFHLGGRRITVSTSGIVPKIRQFVQDTDGSVRLSVSLHSADQETRSELIPINRKYGLSELVACLDDIHVKLKREITFEYTLIGGVNDSIEEARRVAKLAARLNAKVNIIPYNSIAEYQHPRPSEETIKDFAEILRAKHVRVTIRQTAGRDINAACGQLRLDRKTSGTVLS